MSRACFTPCCREAAGSVGPPSAGSGRGALPTQPPALWGQDWALLPPGSLVGAVTRWSEGGQAAALRY